MTFFDALSASQGSEDSEDDLRVFSEALHKLASSGASRFSAGAVVRESSLDRETSARLLLRGVAAGVLRPIYEVECPQCGRLVQWFEDESFREMTLECLQPGCGARFTPRSENVLLLFDFTEQFKSSEHPVPG